eukprot:1095863-Amorphochlora_amoeboformis.AAC.1
MSSLAKQAKHSYLKKQHPNMCIDKYSVATWNVRPMLVSLPNEGLPSFLKSLVDVIMEWLLLKGIHKPRLSSTTQRSCKTNCKQQTTLLLQKGRQQQLY